MTGPEAGRLGLRDAQPAFAARATLLAAVLVPALVAGHWAPVGGPALALASLGSSAVTVDLWAFLAPVVLQALALQRALRGSAPA